MDFKIIAVDFDGTLSENKWPEIGQPNKELIDYLKKRQEVGDKLILWTCRVGELLDNAVAWSAEHGLVFDAVNENLPEVLEWMGGDTRKIFANEYIDDRNVQYFEGQTTAYDVDKVVERLQEENPMYRADGSLMSAKVNISIDKAIEIVKSGGVLTN